MVDKTPKLTFYAKNDTVCPVCECHFKREELLSGSGRLIAGKLTEELRRLYEPNDKYGKVSPLNYPVTVCPDCLFAAYQKDFSKLPPVKVELAKQHTQKRIQMVMQTLGNVDFRDGRTDRSGAASYILAVHSYSYYEKNVAPSIKKGQCALRAAWLLGDLAEEAASEEESGRYYHVQEIMYKKALLFYSHMMDILSTGEEVMDGVPLGPDTDKDWGHEGFLYTYGILNFQLGYLVEDVEERAMVYIKAKRILSKLFGSGKKSRSKPSQILDMARDLYDKMTAAVTQIEEELGKKFE